MTTNTKRTRYPWIITSDFNLTFTSEIFETQHPKSKIRTAMPTTDVMIHFPRDIIDVPYGKFQSYY